jgi:hypothetical protein
VMPSQPHARGLCMAAHRPMRIVALGPRADRGKRTGRP